MTMPARSLAILSAALLFACSPEPKQEAKKWDKNVRNVEAAMVAYPAFQKVLATMLADGRKHQKLANQIKDPEKKAEVMVKANRALTNSITDGLTSIKPLEENIREKTARLRAMRKLTRDERARIQKNIKLSRTVVRDVRKLLAKAQVENVEDAEKIVREATEKLSAAGNSLDRLHKSLIIKRRKEQSP